MSQLGKISRSTEYMIISLTEEDMTDVMTQNDDALVVTAEIDRFDRKRILADGETSRIILIIYAFDNMGHNRKELKKVKFPVIGFARSPIYPLGVINLRMAFREKG